MLIFTNEDISELLNSTNSMDLCREHCVSRAPKLIIVRVEWRMDVLALSRSLVLAGKLVWFE